MLAEVRVPPHTGRRAQGAAEGRETREEVRERRLLIQITHTWVLDQAAGNVKRIRRVNSVFCDVIGR